MCWIDVAINLRFCASKRHFPKALLKTSHFHVTCECTYYFSLSVDLLRLRCVVNHPPSTKLNHSALAPPIPLLQCCTRDGSDGDVIDHVSSGQNCNRGAGGAGAEWLSLVDSWRVKTEFKMMDRKDRRLTKGRRRKLRVTDERITS